eukprot:s3117_g2.t1
MRLVFEVASPAATCELCVRNLSLPLYSVSESDFDELGTVSRFTTHFSIMQQVRPVDLNRLTLEDMLLFLVGYVDELGTVSRFTTHFSIMQQVRPVDLNRLTLEDMLLFLVGYVQDLTTFAHAHLWHDCHTGNLLQSRLQGGTFYWHDLAGKVLSSERHEELQLELMKSSAAPAQPIVIWACQLRKDGSTIEVAGNAIQVKGAIANAAISAAPLSEGFLGLSSRVAFALVILAHMGRLLRVRAAISGRCLSCVRVATAFTDVFCAAGFA